MRLEQADLVARVARLRGQGGPLLYATGLGVHVSGVAALALRRAPAPYSWAHHEACAQMAAYLTVRGREMIGPRELLVDERWVGELSWKEHGETRRRRHRPDFIASGADERRIAVEVELTPKSPARLRSVLCMYLAWLSERKIDSLLYLVGSTRECRQLQTEAPKIGLERGARFGIQALADITQPLHEPGAVSR